MLKKRKTQTIDKLAENLSRSTITVVTDYRGLPAKEMAQLRRNLAELGIEYRVVKNTLLRLAAKKAEKEGVETFLVGPVALAFGYDDIVKPARALVQYVRSSGSVLQIKGGLLGNRVLSSGDILSLSALPSKEVLISRVIGQMRAPIYILHNILSSPLRSFLSILQARIQQMQGGNNVTAPS